MDTDKVTADEALEVTLDNGDMKIEGAYVGLISMNEEERKPFIGKKVGFKTQVNVNELYKTPAQRAAVLQVKENELEGIKPEFSLEITKIRKFAEPELNEGVLQRWLFLRATSKPPRSSEAFVDAEISKELRRESDYLFTLQLRDFLLKSRADHAGRVPQALAVRHQRRQVHQGGDREGFRRFRKTVHLELSPEIFHQSRITLR